MANIKDVAKLAGVSVTTVSRIKGIYHRIHTKVYIKQLISLIMSQIRLLETFLDKNLIILV